MQKKHKEQSKKMNVSLIVFTLLLIYIAKFV